MDHQFELAFDLLEIAAEQLLDRDYTPVTRTTYYGLLTLITRHRYTPTGGHVLSVLAYDDGAVQAAVVATTDHDGDANPHTRIIKVRAGDLMFHAVPGTWAFRARASHTYTLTAEIGTDPVWTLRVDNEEPVAYHDLDDAIAEVLTTA
jgi:hypothetical protein